MAAVKTLYIFLKFKCEFICLRSSFNVFSISERLPILLRPVLAFVTGCMSVLQERNTKIRKITTVMQDSYTFVDAEKDYSDTVSKP